MSREFEFLVPHAGTSPRFVKIRLRAEVDLSSRAGPGDGYLEVESDGGPSGQFELLTRRRHGALSTAWDAVTTSGQSGRVVHGRRIMLTMTNYLVQSEWQPGAHWLKFRLDEYGRFHAAAARILAPTALSATSQDPRPIEVSLTPAGPAGNVVAVSARNVSKRTEYIRTIALRAADGTSAAVVGGWRAVRPNHVLVRVVHVPAGVADGLLVATVTTSHGRSVEPVGAAFATRLAPSRERPAEPARPAHVSSGSRGASRAPPAVYAVWLGLVITLLTVRSLWSRRRDARPPRRIAP